LKTLHDAQALANGTAPTLKWKPRCRSIMGVRVLSCGSYVPDGLVTNDQLGQHFSCDTDWIVRRTGIVERRHVLPHQATSDMCYDACLLCLERGQINPEDIDLILVATYTPDTSFPAVGNILQHRLGLQCAAMDLNVACAGFIYAFVTGATFIKAGLARRVLVVGGDTNSRIANPTDPKTYPLFGDGAGAVVLAAAEPDFGIASYQLGSDGAGAELLVRPGCGSRIPPDAESLEAGLQYLHMDGRAVFRWAVSTLSDSITAVVEHAGITIKDVDYFLTHQANIRIIHAATDVLGIPRDKVHANVRKYGNTSAGSVPLALDEAMLAGSVKTGKKVVMSGFGAGLAWGTLLMHW
jgi:3-oxoacyl-[acyl-carrier-protein] synthase III